MARLGNTLLSLSVQASGVITANRFVGFDNAQVSSQGGKVKGVAEYAAVAGDWIAVTAKGTAIVETGGVIAIGDPIIADASGRAITGSPLVLAAGATAVTSSAANGAVLSGGVMPDDVAGRALEAAAAAGSYVEILLK